MYLKFAQQMCIYAHMKVDYSVEVLAFESLVDNYHLKAALEIDCCVAPYV